MGAITDKDHYTSLITGGSSGAPEFIAWFKHNYTAGTQVTAAVGGAMMSMWLQSGQPCEGTAPGAWANPTNTSHGGLKQTDPAGGLTKWLISMGASSEGTSRAFLLYDRLGHNSGLDATVTTPQTFTGSLTRYNTNGTCVGNMICAEVYAQIGASTSAITASYTNQAGTSGQTAGSSIFGNTGNREVGVLLPLALAAGDTGVQAVANADLTVTTGTAGNFGITVIRPIALIGGYSTINGSRNTEIFLLNAGCAFPIETDACLALASIGPNTMPANPFGYLNFVEC